MHVISPKKLRDFWDEKKESKTVLDNWCRILQRAAWQNLAELRSVFPSVDVVGNCIIFDVGKKEIPRCDKDLLSRADDPHPVCSDPQGIR